MSQSQRRKNARLRAVSDLAAKLPQRAQYRLCAGVRTAHRFEVWTLTLDGATSAQEAHCLAVSDHYTPALAEQWEMEVQFVGRWIENDRDSALNFSREIAVDSM